MKKLMIIAGLLSLSMAAVFATPAKTSKPAALSDTAMEAVKGKGTMVVYVWTNQNGYESYVLSNTYDTGPGGPDGVILIGGPTPGSYPPGYHP